jgi:hypothetical protein
MNLLVCISNDGYEASLEARKIYQSIDDAQAGALGMVRVVDESGDDYLYAAGMFQPVQLTAPLEKKLFRRAYRSKSRSLA